MIKLTPFIAQKFAKEKILEIKKEEDREFVLIHTKTVVECAKLLGENRNIDLDLLEIAAWLHDIGYSQEGHAQLALKILEKERFEISENLKDCIINHGTKGNPLCEEAKILKIADKLSMVNPEMLKIIIKYSLKKNKDEKEKDLEFIKVMVDLGIKGLKDL